MASISDRSLRTLQNPVRILNAWLRRGRGARRCGVQLLLLFLSHLICAVVAAEKNPSAELKNALQQLASQANYSWTSTPKAEPKSSLTRQGPTQGQTELNGFSYFRFNLEGNTVEVALKGEKSAIKTESAWEAENELTGDRAWIARRLQGFKLPHTEAEELIKICRTLRAERGGAFAGELTAEGVKNLLLSRSRVEFLARVSPGAKGTAKFWVKNGRLLKYEINLQGRILLTDHQQEFAINRTTTVEITQIGSTQVQVPEAAKKKLASP